MKHDYQLAASIYAQPKSSSIGKRAVEGLAAGTPLTSTHQCYISTFILLWCHLQMASACSQQDQVDECCWHAFRRIQGCGRLWYPLRFQQLFSKYSIYSFDRRNWHQGQGESSLSRGESLKEVPPLVGLHIQLWTMHFWFLLPVLMVAIIGRVSVRHRGQSRLASFIIEDCSYDWCNGQGS